MLLIKSWKILPLEFEYMQRQKQKGGLITKSLGCLASNWLVGDDERWEAGVG